MKKIHFVLFLAICTCAQTARATENFDIWLSDLRDEAHRKGVSTPTITLALSDIQPIPRVLELDRKQPEGQMTFVQYRERIVSRKRIEEGRALYKFHQFELDKIAREYGVPAPYIVALWGIETSYGENTGGFEIIPALATLAYDGRRSDLFREELFNALKILDEGHVRLENMRGSWAGAMGQNQFMPSSFKRFAVDGNGDGRRDIWTSLPDVFASTANYLKRNNWRSNERWGREVTVPGNLPASLTGLEQQRTVTEWKGMGVRMKDGSPLPDERAMKASIVLPDGAGGPAFLVYDNYRVIRTWNKSSYFASSVGLLADAIAQ